jgi:hypothetical protein
MIKRIVRIIPSFAEELLFGRIFLFSIVPMALSYPMLSRKILAAARALYIV